MAISTKRGDEGLTDLADGSRVPKSHPKIVLSGKIDTLVAYLALVKLIAKDQSELICDIQKYLMRLIIDFESTDLELLTRLENQITDSKIEKGWSYPAVNLKSAIINIARVTTRELEVLLVTNNVKNSISVINRLSDYLFVLYKNFEAN